MSQRLSSYGAASSSPSPVNRMMAEFATDFRDGVDINLGVGYVNERTIPAARIVEAFGEVAAHPDQYRQAFNYGGAQGSPNLHNALRRFYLERKIGGLDAATLGRNRFVVGANGATSLLEAIADVLAPGIVVTADPMYYIYCDFLERKGFTVVTVPEDANGIDTAALEARLESLGAAAEQLAFFYVVTVNNPSSTILSNARRRHLARIAVEWSRRLGRAVPIFFDQAYEWLIHDPAAERPESALRYDTDGLAYEIGTLSKVLAPALRVGFLLGPPGVLLDAVVQKTSDIGFSAPLMNQEVAAFLLDHYIGEQLERVNSGYREKAVAVREAIDTHLGPCLAGCTGGRAGFYFYLTFRETKTGPDAPFFRYLTRTTGNAAVDGPPEARNPRVIYIPGAYCVHPQGASVELGSRQLRLSYGFEEVSTIARAVCLMREAAEYAARNPSG